MGLFSRKTDSHASEGDSPYRTREQKKEAAARMATEADQYAAQAASHGDHQLADEWRALGDKQRNRRF